MLRRLVLIACVCALAACGSTSEVRTAVEPAAASGAFFSVAKPVAAVPKDGDQPSDHFLTAVANYLKLDLDKRGRLAKGGDAGHALDIRIVEFRMRSGFTRQMFGVLAGKDGVASEVTVRGKDGQVLASATVSSFNVMAVGDMDDLARMHGEEIARALLERSKAGAR